jgi:hypothetical protein
MTHPGWLSGRGTVTTSVQHELFLLGDEHLARATVQISISTGFGLQFPAGNREIKHCRTAVSLLFLTLAYLPTGSQSQKFLDTGNIEALFVD